MGGCVVLDASTKAAIEERYAVQSTLGSGGMAVVYRARDTLLGRQVALKILHRQYAENSIFRLRFQQEARAMASLDHENIVRVYDIYHESELPYIVAECVDGKDLASLLSRGRRLGESFTRKVAVQLLEALSYAHRQGVIHRDIKPSNVLITHRGVVKVADFGIARRLEEDEAGVSGEIIGSARYMSPEQLTGEEATPRSDIYSVGILLYHCLTGEPPFTGDIKTLARQQLHAEPRPIRESSKKVSSQMEAVVMKALAKDPRERYSSASAMLKDLDTGEELKVEPPPRRGGRLLAASALTLLLMLAGGGALAAGRYMDDGPAKNAPEAAGANAAGANAGESLAGAVEGEPPQAPDTSPEAPPSGAFVEPGSSAPEEDQAVREVSYVTVPNVRAHFDYSAERILANRGFRVRVVYDQRYGYANRGVTWATEPAIGTRALSGSTITVYATPKGRAQARL